MAGIDNRQIAHLAAGLKIARGVFADAYDIFAMAYDTRLFRQIAMEADEEKAMAPGPERDRRDFNAALRAARDANWLVEFLIDRFADLSAAGDAPARVELQAIAQRNQPFVEAADVTARTLMAARRCCQILAAEAGAAGDRQERAIGSGFLVGANVVLTNHHVVAELQASGGPPPLLRFDHHAGPRGMALAETLRCPDDWLIDHAPAAEGDAVTADRLDYALIRVDGLPGHARGWYDITLAPPPPEIGLGLEIWQFPRGQPMRVAGGTRHAAPAGDAADMPKRIYYDANTLRGSSGGLVLGADRVPVALHEAGYEDATQTLNRGIPLHLIAARAGGHLAQEAANLQPKIGWNANRAFPILGRAKLQRLISEAQSGRPRLIVVATRPDPATEQRIPRLGRSFTRLVLEACLPDDAHHVVDFNAALIDPDAHLTAARLLSMLGTSGPEPTATDDGPFDAEATGRLVDATLAALRAAAPGKTVWLMIDDLDAHPIGTQWAASSYLLALYRRAADDDRLRVVLAGLSRPLEALRDLEQDGLIGFETLDAPPSDTDLGFWIEAHLFPAALPADLAPRMARFVRSVAQPATRSGRVCLTEATALVLRDHARGAFRAQA